MVLIGLVVSQGPDVYAQCTTASSVPIPDPGTITIDIPVGGLTDGQLSSPTQGICRIDIEFEHEYLGDLSVTLVSPSGTQVQLIGPSTTATFPTNLTAWDVSFVPCATVPMPDAGFSPVWSNLQPWQALAFYNGSYHPYDGCLEDFNTGPANGVWQVIVTDDTEFQFGSILSVTLVFCDPAGLDCTPCLANGGVISPDTVTLCAGQNFQSGDIAIDFGGSVPPATLYGYEYLLVAGNSILQHGTSFSAVLPEGIYSVCGLSYALEDVVLVSALLDAGDFALVQDALAAGFYCGDLTGQCIDLEVLNAPDSILTGAMICSGESFDFRGEVFDTPGVYIRSLDGPGICDTIVRIEITARSLAVDVGSGGILGCGGEVTLSAIASGAAGPFSFEWATVNGSITSDPLQSTITVDLPGSYEVQVSDGICAGGAVFYVPEGPGFPDIVAVGGTITCDQPAIMVEPIFVPADGLINWMGPGGFLSMQPNVLLDTPGTYVVSIENAAGCASSDTIEILVDTMTTGITLFVVEKNCPAGYVQLGFSASLPVDSVWWSGPGMFTSTEQSPSVTMSGIYSLTVEYQNGCRRSAVLNVDADFAQPDIMVDPVVDTINCGELITLTASSGTPGATFGWTGQQGQAASGPIITANQSGLYVATATAPNGCSVTDTVPIFEGSDIFDFQLVRDTLDCNTDTAFIAVLSPIADLYFWTDFPGTDSLLSGIEVTQPGTYIVIMRDTLSGCEVSAAITVPADYSVALFDLLSDTVTCTDPLAELQFVPRPGATYLDVYWILPDMSIVSGPVLQTNQVGQYTLVAEPPNGCVGDLIFSLPVDTTGPVLLAESATLGCMDTITIAVVSPDLVIGYHWDGPGIISTAGPTALINVPGAYAVTATGSNGCEMTIGIAVDSNYRTPDVQLVSDSITCLGPATLEAVTSDTGVVYTWIGPSGQVVGNQPQLVADIPGLYILDVQGPNRCVSRDSVLLEPPMPPDVTVTTDTITCQRLSATLTATFPVPPASIVWRSLAGDILSTTDQCQTASFEPVEIIVTGTNGCVFTDTIPIPVDTIKPEAIILQVGDIQCQMRDIVLDGSNSVPADLLFMWSTLDGMLLGDPASAIMPARDTGLYRLVVVRPGNGCADTAELRVTALSEAFGDVEITAISPVCHGEANGSIEVVAIPGAMPPVTYSLNGGAAQFDPVFQGLSAGSYLLSVVDDAGCRLDTLLELVAPPAFTVDAGEDLEILLGQTVILEGQTSLDPVDMGGQAWSAFGGGLLCSDCSSIEISPPETADFVFQVSSISGCIIMDEIRVYVVEKPNYFIPDIFTPNGDGTNDEIRLIIASGVARVRRWIIFDRWGNAVFGRQDFDPGDTSVYWDGRTPDGKELNPAVFAYLVEFELTNGSVQLFNGDITLLR